eukprot:1466251-Amphidinium_carterae.1
MEKITPLYMPNIVTAEGDAKRHVPKGSRHRNEQERIATAGDQDLVQFEQRVYFRNIVPPSIPEWNGL